VRRRDQELATAVDAAIGQLQDRGEVQRVLERYGLTAPSHARSSASAAPSAPAPEAQKAIEAGHSVYSTVCSRCHGAGGVAGGSGGVPTIRNYASGQEKFVRIVQNGKQGTAMAPFKNILTMEEILSVYQYLTSLPPQ
jgi:mono/diheme cytochrome c family protein